MSTIHSSFLIHSVCTEFCRIMRSAIRPSATGNSGAFPWICRIIRPDIRHSATEDRSACRLVALFVRAFALPLACSLALACQRATLTD